MRKGLFSSWGVRTSLLGRAGAPQRPACAAPQATIVDLLRLASRSLGEYRIATPRGAGVAIGVLSRRALVAVFALVLLASCSSKGENATSASADGDTRLSRLSAGLPCEAAADILDCVRRNESSAARKHDVNISRSSGALCLAGSETDEVCLPQQARQIEHRFLERTRGYFVVVEIEHSEGYTVLLVDEKTGSRNSIDNRPLFSPSKEFLATVSYDTDAGYLPNRVAIWNTSGSELLYKVDAFAAGTGPIRIGWLDPARLQVLYSRTPYSAAADENTDSFSIWKDANGTWHGDYRK